MHNYTIELYKLDLEKDKFNIAESNFSNVSKFYSKKAELLSIFNPVAKATYESEKTDYIDLIKEIIVKVDLKDERVFNKKIFIDSGEIIRIDGWHYFYIEDGLTIHEIR